LRGWRLLALVVVTLGALGALVNMAGVSPWDALVAGVQGSFGDPGGLSGTFTRMTPLLFSGLGVALALRAGLFNIGVEGQLLVGALAAAATGIYLTGLPAPLHVTLSVLSGALAGMLWAAPAGLIKVWRGGHEVITTIMLNYIARSFTKYIAANPMQDPSSDMATTVYVADGARLGLASTTPEISWGLVLGIGIAVFLFWWMRRTVAGYELGAVGANADAARAAGVNVKRTIVWAMAASGALAGIAGAMQVCAYEFRFYDGISPGYGFDSLAVALIALANPLIVCLSSLLFGALAQGAQSAQVVTEIPKEIAAVVQGVVILLAAGIGWQRLRRSD